MFFLTFEDLTFEDFSHTEKPDEDNGLRDYFKQNIRNIRDTFKNSIVLFLSEIISFFLSIILVVGTFRVLYSLWKRHRE